MLLANVIAGLVMGFGSSLHCVGMCGPIGCALLMAPSNGGQKLDPFLLLMSAQGGRIAAYTALGGAFGIFGAGLYGIANLQAAHALMQWTAALTVMWIGLSIAGLVPAMMGLDRVLAPVAGGLSRLRLSLAGGYGQLGVAGMIWGLTPCAMVYAAIFNSLLAGSAWGGMAMMAAFGVGTLPAVTLSSMGIFRLSRVTNTARGRLFAGLALVGVGVLGLLLTVPGSPLCISGL